MITRRTLLALTATALLAAACGDDGGGSSTGITVANAWARQSPAATTLGAVYLDVTSAKDDALMKASVPTTVAATVQIHETVMAETSMPETSMPETSMPESSMPESSMPATTMAGSGEMMMRPIARLAVPAGTTVSLKPGGYHIMLIDLAKPLTVGQKFDLTLTFESGVTVTTSVEVREDAP